MKSTKGDNKIYKVLFKDYITDEKIAGLRLEHLPLRGDHIMLTEDNIVCGVINRVYFPKIDLHVILVKYKRKQKKESI